MVNLISTYETRRQHNVAKMKNYAPEYSVCRSVVFMPKIPELQLSSSFVRANTSWYQASSTPPRHHLPNTPTYHESQMTDACSSDFVAMRSDFAMGIIAAMVNMPKLWNTCFGVRSETDARLAKWKGDRLSKGRVWVWVWVWRAMVGRCTEMSLSLSLSSRLSSRRLRCCRKDCSVKNVRKEVSDGLVR